MENNFKNKIINGDSLDELKKIPSETFDLVFADPPYNLQLKNSLSRPDRTKVSAVNDKWDQFESFEKYDEEKIVLYIKIQSVPIPRSERTRTTYIAVSYTHLRAHET